MIETLTHRDMSSRLVSFLLVLCRDFGVQGHRHHHRPEALPSGHRRGDRVRVTITRLLGDLRQSGLVQIDRKKITVLDPIALAKRFS